MKPKEWENIRTSFQRLRWWKHLGNEIPKPRQKLVFAAIADIAYNEQGYRTRDVSIAQLAYETGYTTRTVQIAIYELEDLGIITVFRHPRVFSEYALNVDAILIAMKKEELNQKKAKDAYRSSEKPKHENNSSKRKKVKKRKLKKSHDEIISSKDENNSPKDEIIAAIDENNSPKDENNSYCPSPRKQEKRSDKENPDDENRNSTSASRSALPASPPAQGKDFVFSQEASEGEELAITIARRKKKADEAKARVKELQDQYMALVALPNANGKVEALKYEIGLAENKAKALWKRFLKIENAG